MDIRNPRSICEKRQIGRGLLFVEDLEMRSCKYQKRAEQGRNIVLFSPFCLRYFSYKSYKSLYLFFT